MKYGRADLANYPVGTSWNDGHGTVWVVEESGAICCYTADGKFNLSHLEPKDLERGEYGKGRNGVPPHVFVDWEVPDEPHKRPIWEDEAQYRLVGEGQKDRSEKVVESFRTDCLGTIEALKSLKLAVGGNSGHSGFSYHLLCDTPICGEVSKQGNGEPFVLMANGSVAVCGGNGSARVFDYENQVEYQRDEGPCVLRLEWRDQQWARAVRLFGN